MLLVGQQSTFPKLLFIANRMKIERLINEGLIYSRQDQEPSIKATTPSWDNEKLDLRGEDARYKVEPNPTDESRAPRSPIRRSSAMEEFQRQSGVFFDDPEADSDDTNTDGSVNIDSGNETTAD